MRVKLTRNISVDATRSLAAWTEWDVEVFRLRINERQLVPVYPSDCIILDRDVTEADVEIARLKFVVAAYEELIRKWVADVERLRKEVK